MPFLKNKDFKAIISAQKGGNPKAIAIIQAYLKGGTQDDLDRMVHDFYNPDPLVDAAKQEQDPINKPAVKAVEETENPQKDEEPSVDETPDPEAAPDISSELDSDLDGLIDEDNIKDMSFEDFIAAKGKDANRLSKSADHFKMYDPKGREAYLSKKEGEYSEGMNPRRHDIDRSFRDMDGALGAYSKYIGECPDDEMKLDSTSTDDVYKDISDFSKSSHAFGRSWDEEDMGEIKEKLIELVGKYGKSNVAAALNVIKGDNSAYHDKRIGQIDDAIKHYNKQLEGLLK